MGTAMQSTLRRIEEPRFDDDPHDAPIAPDIIPTAWVDRGPPRHANDATSRERLFAEIQSAHETVVPDVDDTFRATDTPARKDKSAARTWMKRALTVFVFALVSGLAAAAWKHHGDAATQTVASWVPLSGTNSSTEPESAAAAEQVDAAPKQATDQPPAVAAPVQAASTAPTAGPEQQIQSMARDLAAMGQQIVELKASIEQLKASQQAMTAAPAPAARAPAPKPPPRAAMLPPRSAPPPAYAPRQIAPTAQAAAVPPSPAAAPPPLVYQAPPQASVQPNGEPVVRPPAPLPLLPDRQ
jgi:hypothetical protein